MNYFLPGLYVWPLVRADWHKVCSCPLFFSHSEHVAGSIRVFDDSSIIKGRSSVPLWVPPHCLRLLQSNDLGIGILRHLAGFDLQYGRCSLNVVFLGVLGITTCLALGGLLT